MERIYCGYRAWFPPATEGKAHPLWAAVKPLRQIARRVGSHGPHAETDRLQQRLAASVTGTSRGTPFLS
jgi:hypothetical protein